MTEDACPSICIFQFRKIISGLQTQLECEVYSKSCWMYLIVRVGLGPGFESMGGQLICSSPKPSIPTLGPNQHPIQWVPVFLPGGKAARLRSWPLTSNAEVKNEQNSTSAPPACLHDGNRDNCTLVLDILLLLLEATTLFPFNTVGTRTTNKFTVQYDIYKTRLHWNQSINAGDANELDPFLLSLHAKDCSRFLCHWPLSLHSNEDLYGPTTLHHTLPLLLTNTRDHTSDPWRR